MKDSYGISDEVIQEVLQEQKNLEKSWLKLEKRLAHFNAEIRFLQKMGALFEESVSIDKLEAVVKLKQSLTESITAEQMKTWLAHVGIRFGLIEDSGMEAFLTCAAAGSELLTLPLSIGICRL